MKEVIFLLVSILVQAFWDDDKKCVRAKKRRRLMADFIKDFFHWRPTLLIGVRKSRLAEQTIRHIARTYAFGNIYIWRTLLVCRSLLELKDMHIGIFGKLPNPCKLHGFTYKLLLLQSGLFNLWPFPDSYKKSGIVCL